MQRLLLMRSPLLRPPRLRYAFLNSSSKAAHPVTETTLIPSRVDIISKLKAREEFDVLIIGGGATGSGAALDAATRGLKVACVEREDFASGTSSRSTKLLWGGSRYLAQALVNLFALDLRLLHSPMKTIQSFKADFMIVLNCHRERTFMMSKQPHLTWWQPIAVPLDKWIAYPNPPFGYLPAALGPLGLFPLFFKFYDALSGFNCPPSHIMKPSRAYRKFPQLTTSSIKYCSVFYEGMHDDARSNLAIAQTAAREGAAISNYCEVISLIHEKGADGVEGTKVIGALVKDKVGDASFEVYAKSILFAGGPFTDEMRKMENKNSKEAVTGAAGIHIVLPRYYNPTGIGLVDMNTSDGRFLFFLPWQDHVLVGTTDSKCVPTMRPEPDEREIKWLLNEASKYLSRDVPLRRKDVLSAWSGIRPLAVDPNADPNNTAGLSRDHVVSYNPSSGSVFVSGGKWTTYREMAEDAVSKVVEVTPDLSKATESKTLETSLVGLAGYHRHQQIHLIQEFGVSSKVAQRLVRAYGGRARDVLNIAVEMEKEYLGKLHVHARGGGESEVDAALHSSRTFVEDNREFYKENMLISGHPYLEAEVIFAVRHDWCVRATDFIARRTRLAFLDKYKAIQAVPKVVSLMAKELNWTPARQEEEVVYCIDYLRYFGGPHVIASPTGEENVRLATLEDMKDVFGKVDSNATGGITRDEVFLVSEMLSHRLTPEELDDCMKHASQIVHGRQEVAFNDFAIWWNSDRFNEGLKELKAVKGEAVAGEGQLFG